MQFKIPCEVFARLSIAATPVEEPTVIEELQCVYLEHHKGVLFVIGTNNKVFAIERIGPTDQPDGSVCIVLDPVLIEQCKVEAQFDSELCIDVIPGTWATAKTTFWSYPGNAGKFPPPGVTWKHWPTWRETLLPKKRKKAEARGFLFLDAARLEILAKASPSGRVVFPEIINTEEPIILRDSIDGNWCGMFVGMAEDADEKHYEPAIRPEWL